MSDEKIKNLENENKKLQNEYNALERNYEALCLKIKENKNIIKRLQDELSLSIDKRTKDEILAELQNYKEKYEKLANSVSLIENKLKSATQNCIKYQENEVKYKNTISRLEDRLKNKDKNELSNKKAKKKTEENIVLLIDENKKLEIENKKLMELNEQINKKAKETNDTYEEMKKENQIIYKLLEETRGKLKETQKIIEKLTERMNQEKKNSEQSKYKELYNDVLKGFNTLKNENEILKNDIEFYKNLNTNQKNDLSKQFKIINIIKDFFYFGKPYSMKINKNLDFYISIDNNIKEYENNIYNKLNSLEEKQKKIINKLIQYISQSKIKSKEHSTNEDDLKSQILKLKFENSNLKSEIKKKDSKIEKKKLKKIQLKKEIKELNEQITIYILKQKSSVDLSEIKKLFKYIKEIIDRLKLTMETIAIHLKCKNCYIIQNKLIQLPCGHSMCSNCFNVENKCLECEKDFDREDKVCKENFFLNQVINRYKYAQQQIESDISLMINTLNEYLSKKE